MPPPTMMTLREFTGLTPSVAGKLRITMRCLILLALAGVAFAQDAAPSAFVKREFMIPVRDGVKLHTVIFTPAAAKGPLPILLERTPYGARSTERAFVNAYADLVDDGYIFVFQDIRGRFKSEGQFVMQRPARDPSDAKADRRGHRHLRHHRLAAQERPGQQRPRRHARHLAIPAGSPSWRCSSRTRR